MSDNRVYRNASSSRSEHPGAAERGYRRNRDVFRASYYIPPNPSEVVLDFELPEDETEPRTPEAKVFREIIRKGEADEKIRIISICGKAGVGKSCILRGLGHYEELKQHFPGGIYFVSLGMDATDSTLIWEAIQLMRMCGGDETGKALRGEKSLDLVLEKVREWVKGKKCLALFDDFWERNGLGGAKLRELTQLFSEDSGSVVVMGTRFIDLAVLGTVIEIEEKETESEEAKTILLRHAKFQREEIKEEEEVQAFHKALKICGGLPLFLSVVGRGVAELAIELGCDRELVWRKHLEMVLAAGPNELLHSECDEYPDLATTLEISLELLSERQGNRLDSLSESKLSFPELHRALCVFKKRASIPLSVCRRVWNVMHEGVAFRIAEWFAGVGLADVEIRRHGEKHETFVKLHDSVHMFAMKCAIDEEEVAKWHAQLLDGYIPRGVGNEAVRKWWDAGRDVVREDYLFENVCRHLMSSGNVKEAEGLLLSGEWSKFRHWIGGLSAWEGDFWVCLEGRKKRPDYDEANESERDIQMGLKMVRDAVIDSWGIVQENPRELGHQVFGRLIDCENGAVRRYLRSIERVERKPWLRPLQRSWDRPGEGMMIGEFHLGGHVLDIALHKKSFAAVVILGKEIAIIDLKEMKVTARCVGHNDSVEKVGISRDGKRAFSWSVDGTVRQWDVESGEEYKDLRIQLDDEESDGDDKALCATFSSEMRLIVTGSKRGRIKMWGLLRGERVGQTIHASDCVTCIAMSPDGQIVAAGLGSGSVVLYDAQTSMPLCEELRGHVDFVTGIAFNTDGRLVASCAFDSTIRLWDIESKTQVRDPFVECAVRPYTVVFNEDSKQIFSSNDGSIFVWDVEEAAEIRSWQAHTQLVYSVSVTGDVDSRWAVSGGWDGTVRVWDLQVASSQKDEHIYHEDRVSCVSASPDGRFFVSGSYDKTLRIWDGRNGRPFGEALCGHARGVSSVTVSPDCRQVVSGSWNGNMRVWDIATLTQVGYGLRGHRNLINCIAYSRDGKFVISGSDDATVRIWKVVKDGESDDVVESASKRVKVEEPGANGGSSSREPLRLKTTLRHEYTNERDWSGAVSCVAASPDGQRVLSGLKNGEIWVWDMKSGRFMDRKQSDNNRAIVRIEISETNEVVIMNQRNEKSWWRLGDIGSLTRISRSENTGMVQVGGNQAGSASQEPSDVLCLGRIVHLDRRDEKIGTLPDNVEFGAWAYSARRRVLCVGCEDARVLFFRVEC